MESSQVSITVDVELTNRCNTVCDFCPRDRTPHQGLMDEETFAVVVDRLVELRTQARELLDGEVRMSFCGLGEQLLHQRGPEYVGRVCDIGFEPSMCTNGARLDLDHATRLVDAGLRRIYVNCGEIGDDYERVYGLDFDQLVANVSGFLDIAGARCELHIVLVDHLQDPERMAAVRAFWRDLGVEFFFASPMLNRSGSLSVDGMDFARSPRLAEAASLLGGAGARPRCGAAFAYPFIGYDGSYYLCSSDWEKKVATGSVFSGPILGTYAQRLAVTGSRDPICRHCNHDPINRVTAALAALDEGLIDASELRDLVDDVTTTAVVVEQVASLVAHLESPAPGAESRGADARPGELVMLSNPTRRQPG